MNHHISGVVSITEEDIANGNVARKIEEAINKAMIAKQPKAEPSDGEGCGGCASDPSLAKQESPSERPRLRANTVTKLMDEDSGIGFIVKSNGKIVFSQRYGSDVEVTLDQADRLATLLETAIAITRDLPFGVEGQ